MSPLSRKRWSTQGKKVLSIWSRDHNHVRHPQYLCWTFFNAAVILISQDWVVAIIGFTSMLTIYMQARQDDQSLVEKFGDEYGLYMEKVSRMNFVVGAIQLLWHRKR